MIYLTIIGLLSISKGVNRNNVESQKDEPAHMMIYKIIN